jgi:hypothetical protein
MKMQGLACHPSDSIQFFCLSGSGMFNGQFALKRRHAALEQAKALPLIFLPLSRSIFLHADHAPQPVHLLFI